MRLTAFFGCRRRPRRVANSTTVSVGTDSINMLRPLPSSFYRQILLRRLKFKRGESLRNVQPQYSEVIATATNISVALSHLFVELSPQFTNFVWTEFVDDVNRPRFYTTAPCCFNPFPPVNDGVLATLPPHDNWIRNRFSLVDTVHKELNGAFIKRLAQLAVAITSTELSKINAADRPTGAFMVVPGNPF